VDDDEADIDDLTSPAGVRSDMEPLLRLQSYLTVVTSLLLLTASATPAATAAAARTVSAWSGASAAVSAASSPQLKCVVARGCLPCPALHCSALLSLAELSAS
jgi:hypothetical protein